jgi:phosphatidylserine decarboxylase
MAGDAFKFVLPLLALGITAVFLHFSYVAVIIFILAAYVCYFFRNPNRRIPDGKNLIVSPADGKVVKILKGTDGAQVISIFLNIFNVHINRSPIKGKLEQLEYKRGKFKAAFDDEASRVNEQNVITIGGEDIHIVVRQIAGLIARRVICWKKPGDNLQRGEVLGLIRFGSRVDVVLPEQVKVSVRVGDQVRGGNSVIGEYI